MEFENQSKIPDELPAILKDSKTGRSFERLKFFGKGSYGKCYSIKETSTGKLYAIKIVPKSKLVQEHQRDRLFEEIVIHRGLRNENVVKFYSAFIDDENHYIVLELCKQHSLKELQMNRGTITDYECRFFLIQILRGLEYLHSRNIIHRDIKLSNLFLNDNLNVKIGDFGLATKLMRDTDRRRGFCGTVNYIAPEMLRENYGLKIDIWATGVVMYFLLTGRPPFEQKTVEETYEQIKRAKFFLPNGMKPSAKRMLRSMFQLEEQVRPNVQDCSMEDYIIDGPPIPDQLPLYCLTTKPKFEKNFEQDANGQLGIRDESKMNARFSFTSSLSQLIVYNTRHQLASLSSTLGEILSKPHLFKTKYILNEEHTDPKREPAFWIEKWMYDHSQKKAFGYKLCDGATGIIFWDKTKLLKPPDNQFICAIDESGRESFIVPSNVPKDLSKKMECLSEYDQYMKLHLRNVKNVRRPRNPGMLPRIPHLHVWFRTEQAITMHLSNGIVQINFYDHMKLILCPKMGAVTFIDSKHISQTVALKRIASVGLPINYHGYLVHAHEIVKSMLN